MGTGRWISGSFFLGTLPWLPTGCRGSEEAILGNVGHVKGFCDACGAPLSPRRPLDAAIALAVGFGLPSSLFVLNANLLKLPVSLRYCFHFTRLRLSTAFLELLALIGAPTVVFAFANVFELPYAGVVLALALQAVALAVPCLLP